jgi:hypothetical protein
MVFAVNKLDAGDQTAPSAYEQHQRVRWPPIRRRRLGHCRDSRLGARVRPQGLERGRRRRRQPAGAATSGPTPAAKPLGGSCPSPPADDRPAPSSFPVQWVEKCHDTSVRHSARAAGCSGDVRCHGSHGTPGSSRSRSSPAAKAPPWSLRCSLPRASSRKPWTPATAPVSRSTARSTSPAATGCWAVNARGQSPEAPDR